MFKVIFLALLLTGCASKPATVSITRVYSDSKLISLAMTPPIVVIPNEEVLVFPKFKVLKSQNTLYYAVDEEGALILTDFIASLRASTASRNKAISLLRKHNDEVKKTAEELNRAIAK